MAELGSLALLIALVLCAYLCGWIGGLAGSWRGRRPSLGNCASRGHCRICRGISGFIDSGGICFSRRLFDRIHPSSQQSANCRSLTNLPCCGPGKKVRCFSGRCCSRPMAQCCDFATRPTRGCLLTPRSSLLPSSFSFLLLIEFPPPPFAMTRAQSLLTATALILFCSIRRW